MARRRFLVALVPPDALSDQLRGLRVLTGGPARERIAPHVTLVPPFNADAGSYPEIRSALRDAATATEPFDLTLGPGASFAPQNATLHLAVRGSAAAMEALVSLRERIRVGPLARPDRHGFVPHLTLRRHAPEAMTAAAAEVLCGRLDWAVDGLQLLEQVPDGATTGWQAIAEEPFGGPVVVGRGGIELHLRTVRVVEPLLEPAPPGRAPVAEPSVAGDAPFPPDGSVHGRLVVVAERPGEPGVVVGRAVGLVGPTIARLCALEVVEAARGEGIARQVLARWCTDAARAGATIAVTDAPHPEPLRSLGFTGSGTLLTRVLSVP